MTATFEVLLTVTTRARRDVTAVKRYVTTPSTGSRVLRLDA